MTKYNIHVHVTCHKNNGIKYKDSNNSFNKLLCTRQTQKLMSSTKRLIFLIKNYAFYVKITKSLF